jgi:lipopolysaccharide transport system permease protein
MWYRALAELRAEAARAYLGFLWWIVEPILYMAAFYIVFGLVFQRGGEDFVPFLLCGLVVWKWFGSTVTSSSNAIPSNAGLIQQVYLPKYLLPAIVVVINTVKFLVVLGLLLTFLVLYGYMPGATWLALPVLVGIQLLLVIGVSGLVSAVIPFLPDLRLMLENIMMLLFFLSGIFFDIDASPQALKPLLWANPLAVLIDSYRSILLDGVWPDMQALGIVLFVSLISIGLAGYVLSRFDGTYPKVLI